MPAPSLGPRAATLQQRATAAGGGDGIADLRQAIEAELRKLQTLARALEEKEAQERRAAAATISRLVVPPEAYPGGDPALGMSGDEYEAPSPCAEAPPGELGLRMRAATRPRQFVRDELLRLLSGQRWEGTGTGWSDDEGGGSDGEQDGDGGAGPQEEPVEKDVEGGGLTGDDLHR
jgi:hypothetical protein